MPSFKKKKSRIINKRLRRGRYYRRRPINWGASGYKPNYRLSILGHKPLSGNGLPFTLCTNFRYAWQARLQCATLGAMSTYQWRLASMYDPDFTGVGAQPYLFDQLAAFYKEWIVVQADITLRMTPEDPSQKTMQVFVREDPLRQGEPSTADYYMEMPTCKNFTITANQGATYRKKVFIPKLVGDSAQAYLDNDSNYGTTGANPTASDYAPTLNVGFYEPTASVTGATMQASLIITYHVKFRTINLMPQS